MSDPNQAKNRAISLAGGVTAVSKLCGVSKAAVSQWPWVPLRHVPTLARATGLSFHQIRPDIYDRRAA